MDPTYIPRARARAVLALALGEPVSRKRIMALARDGKILVRIIGGSDKKPRYYVDLQSLREFIRAM